MDNIPENKPGEIILYTTPQGGVRLEVIYHDETFWLSQKRMAELFGVDVRTISEHLINIYGSNELQESSTIRKIRIVQKTPFGVRNCHSVNLSW